MAYSGLVPISPNTTPMAAMVNDQTPAFSTSVPLELIVIFTSSLATVLVSLGLWHALAAGALAQLVAVGQQRFRRNGDTGICCSVIIYGSYAGDGMPY